jgi:hypothetical protein
MKVTTNNAAVGQKDPNTGNSSGSKVEGTGKVTVNPQEPAQKPAERPAGLPEGFNTWEELAAAYQKVAPKKEEKPAEPPQPDPKVEKLDMNALEQEWRDNGQKLSDETIAKLEKQGITKEMITEHIGARQTQAAAWDASLAEHVGGKDNLDTLLEFAAKNLDAATIERYNSKLQNTKSPAEAKEVLDLIFGKYEGMYGKSGRSATAGGSEVSAPGGVKPIADMQELTDLMRDPRYKKGQKAFLDEVDRRLAVSPHLIG